MSSKSSQNNSGPRITNDGHQPSGTKGFQPVYTPNPGAGHQPTGTGAPTPPSGGSGVRPGPAKK